VVAAAAAAAQLVTSTAQRLHELRQVEGAGQLLGSCLPQLWNAACSALGRLQPVQLCSGASFGTRQLPLLQVSC
jgi:hypothetical protein